MAGERCLYLLIYRRILIESRPDVRIAGTSAFNVNATQK